MNSLLEKLTETGSLRDINDFEILKYFIARIAC